MDGRGSTESAPPERPLNRFRRLQARLHRNRVTSLMTKIFVTILGLAVIGAGLVMMVTPGPGIVGIILGLAILATEWHWAEQWMHAMKAKAEAAADRARDLDPKVRRRRLLLSGSGLVVIVGAIAGMVYQFGWPAVVVRAWDWVQGLGEFVPELPGM